MAIIVSKDGKNAVKLDKSTFKDEKDLQQYICQNPDSVPLCDIKSDIKLLILAREFPTRAGAIDVLGVDREGEIYIVETKLYKNPDKRAVVAQVLDYGANLWKYGQNFDDFISRVEDRLNTGQQVSLNETLKEFYGLDEEEIEDFRQSLRQHLIEGSFKFLVLMDSLHDGLKDLILFLNQNSRFSLFAVEFEIYKHDGNEIVTTKLFGAENPKSSVGSGAIGRGSLTPKEFLELLGANAGPEIASLAEKTIREAPEQGLYVVYGKDGASLKFKDTRSSKSFNLGKITIDGKLGSKGMFSANCLDLGIPRNLWEPYYNALSEMIPGSEVEPWPSNKEKRWLSDGSDDWPAVEPLLRNRQGWFKVIKDTMTPIHPLLNRT